MEEIQTGKFKGKSFSLDRWRKPLLYAACVVVAAAVATSIGIVVNNNSKKQMDICTQKANLPLMNQAATDISSNNITSLMRVASKVSALPNYKNDPNCLYVLFQGSLNIGDIPQAQSYLSALEKIYPKNGLYSAFGEQSISRLKTDLDNEQIDLKIVSSETVYLSNPKYAKK